MSQDFLVLKKWTQARIGLERTGHSLSTPELLAFRRAHSIARDAVLAPWKWQETQSALNEMEKAMGAQSLFVESRVNNRKDYLERPDLGKVLSDQAIKILAAEKHILLPYDIAVTLSDGLSATAIERHGVPLLTVLLPLFKEHQLRVSPIVLAPFSRVALSDEIGFHLGAQISIILIGERPGLSAADSLGIYFTYEPRSGRSDAQRNCISNIRPPFGLSYAEAAGKLMYLIRESRARKLSGVDLKEQAQCSLGEETQKCKIVHPESNSFVKA